MVRVDERATIEDVANHWWVNWGFEETVCDCPSSSPHQECPSPLLARYIDWQNRVAAKSKMTADPECISSDSSCLPQHLPNPCYFSLPLRSDRRGGGGGGARGGISSLRKSRKENAIPQTAGGACGGVCAAAASSAAISTMERKKPKGILKPQRSFDSVFHNPPKENTPSQPCNSPSHHCRTHALSYLHTDVLSTSLPPPSTFSQPSSKMPKKGILKNLCEGESGCGSSTERRNSEAGLKESDTGDLCSHKQHSCHAAVENPSMRTEAVRRRKGILKRNGKFSRSLDLPDDHYSSSPPPVPAMFPEVLQQLVQAAEGGRRSRPSSMVSEDSLFSSDSFDLLDLSAQSRRKIFSRRKQHSACSSEEDVAPLRAEKDREGRKWLPNKWWTHISVLKCWFETTTANHMKSFYC